MSYVTSITYSILRGAIAGWLAVIATACIGFLFGLYALSIGTPISSDFESTPIGLIALTSFLIVVWGIPTSIGGILVSIASQIAAWFFHESKVVVYMVASGLTAFVWVILIVDSSLPFRSIVFKPQTDVASAIILCIFITATMSAAAWVARWARSGKRPSK